MPAEDVPRAQGPKGASQTASRCHVVSHEVTGALEFDRPTAEGLLAAGRFFWIDLYHPVKEDFEVLRDVFRFHPLAIEDAEYFNQRAKIEEYDDFIFLILYGASPDEDRLVEVHCFYSERLLITIHRDDSSGLLELRQRYQRRQAALERPSLLLYGIIDGLLNSFFPVMAAFDDRIDELEDRIFAEADEKQLQELFNMKRIMVGMRKAVTPQRDAFAGVLGRISELPGLGGADEHYFRDNYDHLIRISDLVDSYRDLLTSAMDVYLSTVSNRLNGVMKQLTIIATIFLPLSFLTGFFGENFGWLVEHIGSWQAFVGIGVGTEVLAIVAMLATFKARGWF